MTDMNKINDMELNNVAGGNVASGQSQDTPQPCVQNQIPFAARSAQDTPQPCVQSQIPFAAQSAQNTPQPCVQSQIPFTSQPVVK
ncbi:MAG: hypothetical protein IJ123_06445 [Blautia sp.]|nr:hypothetical protein [Blautia sp.]